MGPRPPLKLAKESSRNDGHTRFLNWKGFARSVLSSPMRSCAVSAGCRQAELFWLWTVEYLYKWQDSPTEILVHTDSDDSCAHG